MSEKFYLGISLGFNSSACVISSERGLIAAISQERLNGEKNTKQLPMNAISKCLEIAGVSQIERIAISHYETITDDYFLKYGSRWIDKKRDWKDFLIEYVKVWCCVDIANMNIKIVNHHAAHAFSTLAFYDIDLYDECVTITSDGFGEGVSGQITDSEKGILSTVPLKNSIALVYQFVTGALGFKMHQHEGKITGLAAFGKPIYVENFEALYNLVDEGNGLEFKDEEYSLDAYELEQVAESAIIDFDKFLKLKKAVFGLVNSLTEAGAKREDIAASVQEFSEKYTLNWINRYCKPENKKAYIAGGLFANVKINQRIKDLRIFEEVNVCPAMGDEGTCVGAALIVASQNSLNDGYSKGTIPQKCGTSVGDKGNEYQVVIDYLTKKGIRDEYVVNESNCIIDDIADRLADNKIVCLMRSNMEFGPRALCHRSILYNCDTRETNDWLNKKLSRTEFMPFAPVCREEVADDLFINLDGGRNSARFMTMTFDCTDEFAQNYPAACHIDNTARPQIVSKKDDPFIWSVLDEYERRTGKKALINTSFNLHNWPIIENEEVGLDSWITSDTDCLVIGNVIIEKA